MASTTALFTGLTGLNANSRFIDVIGNNIANVNTTAFKSNRLQFASQFSRTFSVGTPPGDTTGGTNPGQIGLGVTVAGTQRNFNGGAINATGDSRDMAIEGEGFFVVTRGGETYYTRAGAFRPNNLNDLVTIGGERLMGWGVDDQYNIVRGELQPVNVPVGALTLAEATENVRFSGNLRADGLLPTRGSAIALRGTASAGLQALAAATPAPTAPNVLETTTRLVDIEDPASAGNPLFADGQILRLTGVEKGVSGTSSKTLPDAQLDITATTTVDDLIDFLNQALGINTGTPANPDAGVPGIALDPLTGILTVTGNSGSVNDINLASGDLRLLDATGTFVRSPFVAEKTGVADGESVRTSFVAYDSLGKAVTVDLSMVLENRPAAGGTVWRYYVESADDTDLSLVVGTGTVTFDDQGRLTSSVPISATIDRAGSGASQPLVFDINLTGSQGSVTALAGNQAQTKSTLVSTFTDGAPLGTLSSYAVGENGIIIGSFSNGLTRTVGQVATAKFSNPEGLVDRGSNLFSVGPNSGSAQVTEPLVLGAGKIVGGSLELSNVDLGNEFLNLILAQTGYSASTRIIRTTDELMQQLLTLGR